MAELKMWNIKLASNCDFKNSIEALQICNKDIYPNIYFLFKILVTLPVSTTTPERSFSTLKRLKSYCRNSMNEVYLLTFNIYNSQNINVFIFYCS